VSLSRFTDGGHGAQTGDVNCLQGSEVEAQKNAKENTISQFLSFESTGRDQSLIKVCGGLL
jgi:hypothetical protein